MSNINQVSKGPAPSRAALKSLRRLLGSLKPVTIRPLSKSQRQQDARDEMGWRDLQLEQDGLLDPDQPTEFATIQARQRTIRRHQCLDHAEQLHVLAWTQGMTSRASQFCSGRCEFHVMCDVFENDRCPRRISLKSSEGES